MGAGKTTVGALLAEAWGVEVRDTDADIEALEGRSISDIFVDSGEAHFRDLERKAVAEALATHDGVLALGGGAVLDPATRELLAGHTVVFLRVGLVRRGQAGRARQRRARCCSATCGPGSRRCSTSARRSTSRWRR